MKPWSIRIAYEAAGGTRISTSTASSKKQAYAIVAKYDGKPGVLGYNVMPPNPNHHDQMRFKKFEGKFVKCELPFNDEIPF